MQQKKLLNLFKLNLIDPMLLYAPHFQHFGLINNKIAKLFPRKMILNSMIAGLAITNLGKLSFPRSFGNLELVGIFGPSVHSELLQKIIGTCTFDGKMHFMLTHDTDKITPQEAKEVVKMATDSACSVI